LFAYGGNGGLLACGVAEKVGIRNIYLFVLGPVFSAFGSCVSDISHVYERAVLIRDFSPADAAKLTELLVEVREESTRDLLGEGIKPCGPTYSLEVEASPLHSGRSSVVVALNDGSVPDAPALRRKCEAAVGGPAIIELLRVRLQMPMPKPALQEKSLSGGDASHANKGKRNVAWGSSSGEAVLFNWDALKPGDSLEGCAVLEGSNSTYFVPQGWTMDVDKFGNAKVSRK